MVSEKYSCVGFCFVRDIFAASSADYVDCAHLLFRKTSIYFDSGDCVFGLDFDGVGGSVDIASDDAELYF